MRATVLVDGKPKREPWMEPEEVCRKMAERAELMYSRRKGKVRAVQAAFDLAHAIEDLPHIKQGMIRACEAAGVDLAMVLDRGPNGNLFRGEAAIARRKVYKEMRRAGFSYPEIAAAFGTSHSSVITSLRLAV